MPSRPKKPKFKFGAEDAKDNKEFRIGDPFALTVVLNPGGGGHQHGGIAQVFSRNGRIPLQRIIRLTDTAAAAEETKDVRVIPVRGQSHSVRVTLWDRRPNQAPTHETLNHHKLKFQTE